MNVKVKLIQSAAKPQRLADASIELTDADGDSVIISDIRVLENRQGQTWIAMPSRSIKQNGRTFQYAPQIEPNRALQRKIEDAVLTAFEQWKQSQVEMAVRP